MRFMHIMHAVPADGNLTLLSNPIMQSEVIRLPVSEDQPLTVIVLMVASLSSPQYHDQANHMEAIGARKSPQSPDDITSGDMLQWAQPSCCHITFVFASDEDGNYADDNDNDDDFS